MVLRNFILSSAQFADAPAGHEVRRSIALEGPEGPTWHRARRDSDSESPELELSPAAIDRRCQPE
jgi:hypothetical protein